MEFHPKVLKFYFLIDLINVYQYHHHKKNSPNNSINNLNF
jgi:hypothetical protein